MAEARTTERLRTADVLERYGHCLELAPMDTRFHNISVGLYHKEGVLTVWSFSGKPGVQGRLEAIRDQLVALGDLEPVKGTHNQARFACGHLHRRPLKFLLAQAVGKAPDYAHSTGDMTVKDTKTALTLFVDGRDQDGRWVYQITAEGADKNAAMRVRMIVAGFVRYGEMEKVSDTEVAFSCGQRHDNLLRLLLPYARNVSSVESMLDAEALRGQMTTGTLGFTPL